MRWCREWIHANTALKYPWVGCRTRICNRKHFGDSSPHLKALVTTVIRIWLFSGDLDAMVPGDGDEAVGGEAAAGRGEGLAGPDKDVAGYVVTYKGLVQATVRGSGHMVNIDQPERGFALFPSFLRGEPLPSAAPQTD